MLIWVWLQGKAKGPLKSKISWQDQPAERQEIEAHRFVLALSSEIFRAQFYGGLKVKPGEEIEILDWSFYAFKIFVKSFYTEVNLEKYNIMTLCELYYIGDYYNVSELKVCQYGFFSVLFYSIFFPRLEFSRPWRPQWRTPGMMSYLVSTCPSPLISLLAHIPTSLRPSMGRCAISSSTAVADKLRTSKTSSMSTGKEQEDQVKYQTSFSLFPRDLFGSPIYDEVIKAVVARVGPCQNCSANTTRGGNCLYSHYLDWRNFKPGALVITVPSEFNQEELHKRVYRLGQFFPETNTFTSFDKFGAALPIVKLKWPYRDFKFNCSAGNADPSVISSID